MIGWAIALLVLGLAAWWLLRRWQWRRELARGLPPVALAIMENNVAQYRAMNPDERARLQRLVQHFLRQKTFVGCAGLVLADEMRVTIAAQACLLVLGRMENMANPALYPGLDTILVYPGAFTAPRREVDAAGVVTDARHDLLGESWGDGRVLLAWDHVRRAGHVPQAGHNVVLHEFAHQLDTEDGSANGAPFLGSRERYRSWAEVLGRHFEQLRHEAEWGWQGVLDHYGASNPAEFFAVATETFFELPHEMAARHPDLYAEFVACYGLDPRRWMPLHAAAPEPQAQPGAPRVIYGQWR